MSFIASLVFFATLCSLVSEAALVHYQQQQQLDAIQMQTQAKLQQSLQQPSQQYPVTHLHSQIAPNTQDFGSTSHTTRSTDSNSAIFRFYGTEINSTSVKLIWSLRNGYHANSFDIQWGKIPHEVGSNSVTKLNGTTRDYTLSQLQPDTEYQFELRAYGDHPFRPQLEKIKTHAVNQANRQDYVNKDIMPLGVKAEAKSNSSIQLSWTEPQRPMNTGIAPNKVNIIRYYVNPSLISNQQQNFNESVQNMGATLQYQYKNVTNLQNTRVIIQKLKPATEYAFAVKTVYYSPDMKKIFAQSGFSMDTLAKTFDLEPSAPLNFTIQALTPTREESLTGHAGKLSLNWQPPESPNGQLKGYTILFSRDASTLDDDWERIEVKDPNQNNWVMNKLQLGDKYYFKIRATNQKGAGQDSETRLYVAPAIPLQDRNTMPIPPSNVLLMIAICMLTILFLLSLVVSRLACGSRRKPRKGSMNTANNQKMLANGGTNLSSGHLADNRAKLNGFASTIGGNNSTVAGRVGTLARRRDNKPDFWISAMDQQQEIKSNISEKSNSDLNMAMVSIQRDSPQFATTQLAPPLPEYRFTANSVTGDQLMQQLQHQQQLGHYHPGQFTGQLAYDQMDNATASALMTLSKRQQQQLQKYQIQFATTGGTIPSSMANSNQQPGAQAPSPHQQPPPPPPLNIEHQQQSLYGTHQTLANTRSLRLHRPTLYDPVSGSFVQATEGDPPNYSSHTNSHMQSLIGGGPLNSQFGHNNIHSNANINSNTLQFHPHQTSTLLSRRSTNTLRSFQTSNATYGQLGGINGSAGGQFNGQLTAVSVGQSQQQPAPAQMLQSHQAVINQLNNSSYPSLPLKHVSAVRPQIMSSLEDRIELELAEKEQQQPQQPQLQLNQQNNEQSTIKQ